nr:G-type lectin S-receptor-like serine/threonine-protein kinase At1g11410 [Ipomoea batatas]
MRSWKSPDDPGTGEYTVGIDLTGKPQAFLYKNSSSRVWRVGPWNGIRWSGVPQMTPEITPYAFIENDEEFSEEYWIRDPLSVYSIVMLNDSGTLNKIIWKGSGNGDKKWDGVWYYPNDDCDYYGHCGAFGICDSAGFSCRCVSGFKPKSNQDWRQGCWRNATEVCRNGEGFLKLENMKIPDTAMTAVNTTIGLEECLELCLSNCSCSAYARANISDGGTGCITWYGDLIDMREFTLGGQDMYVRVSASDLDQLLKKSKEHNRKRLIFSAILSIAAVILVLYCLVTTNIREDVLAFDLNTIRVATNNFSADNKLGEGGFGSVYKGMLQNGQFVAIKTLSRTSQQGIEEFKNEVKLIARLQHRNLVKLLGCCIQQGEKMLVYEYLPNKALDNVIFGKYITSPFYN